MANSKNQRAFPNSVKQRLSKELDLSLYVVSQAIEDLVDESELVYTYRDPSCWDCGSLNFTRMG